MKGLCLNENQELELRAYEIPEPPRGFVRVKIKRAGICASDIGYWKHGSDRLKLPVILGHEMSGVVEKLGEGVCHVKENDRVIVTTTYYVCGKCRFCKENKTNLCIERKGLGSKENGGFAEYIIAPETSIIKMKDTMTFEQGALVEPLACAVHGIVENARIRVKDKVLVIGPGALGILSAQVAQVCGAQVILAGLNQDAKRLEIAKNNGIDTFNIQEQDVKDLVQELTGGYGFDCVIEASGSYKALDMALEVVVKTGQILDLGYYHGDANIDLSRIMLKEITVIGALSHKSTSWIMARDLIDDKKVKVDMLVSDVLPIEDYEQAFEKAVDISGFKVLFDLEK